MILPLLNKKKMISVILGESSPGDSNYIEEKKVDGYEKDFKEAYKAIAGDIISAVKQENSEKLYKSLKQFLDMCEKESYFEEEEAEDPKKGDEENKKENREEKLKIE